MNLKSLSTPSVGLAVGLVCMTAATWGWQVRVFRSRQVTLTGDAWEHVKEEYPLSHELPPPPTFSPGMAEALVLANPFSHLRHVASPPSGGGTAAGGTGATPPLPPQFVYKGQISVGQHQRAILEDTTAQKTHFLEVGQEVAGFKVLDISQNQVVLWDSQQQKNVVVSLVSTTGAEAQKPTPVGQ